jgi:hypothetical protein
MRYAGVLVMATGCRAVFGLEEPVRAMPIDALADTTADTPIDARPSCVERWLAGTPRFALPVPLTSLNSTATEQGPSGGTQAMVWGSDRSGGMGAVDIWYSLRSSATAPWSTPAVFPGVNSTATDARLTATSDGLYGVISSNRVGGVGGFDVWTTVRSSTAVAFPAPTQAHVAMINTTGDQADPAISGDGLELLFLEGSTLELVSSVRSSRTVEFPAATAITELNNGTGERDPTPGADGRLLLFTSNRPGGLGGGGDIWYAVRSGRGQPYGTPMPVPQINSAATDADAWLTEDGCRIYFISTLSGGSELYEAVMMDPD